MFRARFGTVDDLHVAVVGDVDVTTVEELAGAYLATLPAGAVDEWVDTGVEFPVGVHTAEVVLPEGTANGGILVGHHAEVDLDPEHEAAAAVLQTVIDARITEVIRERLAASYGGFSSVVPGRLPREAITSLITIDGDPARLDEIRRALRATLVELAVAGPTAEEFARAVSVISDDWAFVDYPTFLQVNLDAGRYPDADRLTPDNRGAVLAQLRPADVRDLASTLYGDGDWVEVAKVLP